MTVDTADGAVLDAVRGLHWAARRRAPAGMSGEHRSRALGGTAEFTEYRVYRPGDDVRRIDWKLLARSDRAFIRLSTDRTVLTTMLVVDASASMAFPAPSVEKWVYARRLALALVAIAHGGGDPVGLIVRGPSGVVRLPPRTRRGVVAEAAQVLAGVRPGGAQPLAPELAGAGAPRVVIISDFLGDADALTASARTLVAAGREVYAMHIIHVAEQDPRRSGQAVDPEDASIARPLTAATRQRYVDAFVAWQESLARRWYESGATYARIVTDEPVAHAARRITRS